MSKKKQRRSSQRRRMYWKRYQAGEFFPVSPEGSAGTVTSSQFFLEAKRFEIGDRFATITGINQDGEKVEETVHIPAMQVKSFDELLMLVGLKRSTLFKRYSRIVYPYHPPPTTVRRLTDEEYERNHMGEETKTENEENKNLCDNCSQEYEGEAQACEHCGLDGLGPCCIGQLEHPCEDSEEEDDE